MTIESLRRSRCIEEKEEGTLWESGNDEQVRLTSLGRYQAGELVKTFQYVDAVITDTPILDADVRAAVSDSREIEDRIARVRLFVDYLDRAARHLEDHDADVVWQDVSRAIKTDLEIVEANAERWRVGRTRN